MNCYTSMIAFQYMNTKSNQWEVVVFSFQPTQLLYVLLFW